MVAKSIRSFFGDLVSVERNVKVLIVVSVVGNWIIGSYMFNLFVYSLGAEESQLGLIFSIGAVTAVFASLAGGYLADRFNRKYLYTLGVYGIAVTCLLYTLVDSWENVVPIHIALTVFSFFMASAWRPLMADSVSPDKRGFTFGVLGTVTAINWTIGNATGGFVAEAYGFKIMWWLIFLALSLQATLAFIFLRETERGTSDERELDSSSRFNLFNAENRSLISVYAILLIFSLQSGFVSPFLPIYLENLGFSESVVGLVGSLSFLAMGATLLFLGRMSDRMGRRLPISCFLVTGAIFTFVIPFAKHDVFVFLLASFANLGLSTWYLLSVIQPLVADLSKAEWRGRAMSIMFTVMNIGGIIGPTIGGFMWENMPVHIPFMCSSLINVALAILLMKTVSEPNMNKKKYSVSKVAMRWSKKENPPLMDPWEVDLLIKYARKCKVHFVEIGTHKGGSASLISKYLPKNVNLTTIDTFEKPPKGSIPPGEKPPKYEEAKETIEKQGDISKVEIIKGYSWKVAENWDKDIDILFIDGDHRYEAVRKDFNSWEPHVVKDGHILMHDVTFKGVRKAYKEILQSTRFLLKERVGTVVVIKKYVNARAKPSYSITLSL